MPEPETAYLLTGEELLLLLSLVDQRPVVAFALPDATRVPAGQWAQVAVELHRKGLVDYTGAGTVPAAPVAELLTAMKEAGTVCLALSRDADYKAQVLYRCGEQSVLLQGNYWPGYRLQAWEQTPDCWLDTCLGLPERIPDGHPALPESQLPDDLDGLPCPALTDPPVSWGQWEQARTIMDVYENGRLEQRLVWWQGEAGGVILCQARSDTHVFLDCRLARDALNRHLWKGEPL